jgi:hypothetical protein
LFRGHLGDGTNGFGGTASSDGHDGCGVVGDVDGDDLASFTKEEGFDKGTDLDQLYHGGSIGAIRFGIG